MTVQQVVAIILKGIQKRSPMVITGKLNRAIAMFSTSLPKTWITNIAYKAIASQKLQNK